MLGQITQTKSPNRESQDHIPTNMSAKSNGRCVPSGSHFEHFNILMTHAEDIEKNNKDDDLNSNIFYTN